MASSSGSVFSETLQEIINAKLEELSKRRSDFESTKADIISALENENRPTERLGLLSRGVKTCFGVKTNQFGQIISDQSRDPDLELELKYLDRFLTQSKYDPSVSSELMRTWEESLFRHLDTQSLKFQYASLYAQLVTEWLSTEKSKANAGDDVAMMEGFEDVADTMKQDARRDWEKVVFEPANVNDDGLRAYLNHMFGLRSSEKTAKAMALQQFRTRVADSVPPLQWVADGLLSSDLLTDEKREVLRNFKNNPIILAEVADVLNMRLAALETWSWGPSVPLEQRRKISGIYNVLMHEDLLQALFLHYLGVKWSMFLKSAFEDFRNFPGAWKSSFKDIPKMDMQRRGYYLGGENRKRCVQAIRDRDLSQSLLHGQPDGKDTQQNESLEGEEEVEFRTNIDRDNNKAVRYAQQQGPLMQQRQGHLMAQRAGRGMAPVNYMKPDDDEEDGEPEAKRPMEAKQRLIRLLSTEIAVNTKLNGEITAFHSMFESWNSLLPHTSMLTVMLLFGVSKTWIGFFTKFLKAPLKFLEDEPSAAPRTRCRGTPASHVLSDIFGESMLFCLDFAVNQSTGGSVLFRMHDDFWFWSRDHSVAVTAWKSVSDFVNATGTYISPSKSGTVRISRESTVSLDIDRSLPEGDIRWGFLKLSTQTGRFEIDQTIVDKHVTDLRKQLYDKRKSIISFIQAWNTYAATFFTSNFGKPANCFGQDHVDQMLATHQRIQREVFSPSSSASLIGEGNTSEGVSSVVDYLKKLMAERFGVSDIPDAYLFFPIELGGLDLKSPFISILQVRNTVLPDPTRILDTFLEAERDNYNVRKAAFDKGWVHHQGLDNPNWQPESQRDRETFMSFDEFARYRQDMNYNFHNDLEKVYKKLLELPSEEGIIGCSKVTNGIQALSGQGNLKGIHHNWHGMDPYWRWIAQLHGPEAMDRFGGLNIVEPGLLPIGMVSIFRDKRVKWQG
ncbi:Uu.00g007800.m01.CDS01 [Anthostomella pinea]|uniref:Uu.00g007800.m01.CDS01 n=1 Tax=Anthostomella pinea TaxID=933095 RepID=A0AAI8VX31_9PEZI|nr:Uu.00g007800.m01.CDS01 [Anthostomella pinea]